MKTITIISAAGALCILSSAHAETHSLFIGTYTGGATGSKGIYASTFDDQTGALTEAQLVAETESPSFLALSPDNKFVYAVNETNEGSVSAFRIKNDSDELESLNTKPTGSAPCHVSTSSDGKYVLFANYSGGSIGAYATTEDGTLGERTAFVQHTGASGATKRQSAPNAHSINLDSANKFAIVSDLGLDKVITYAFDADKGTLAPTHEFKATTPGNGPRHFALHPSEKFGYSLNEITRSVTACTYDSKTGDLTAVGTTSTLPTDAKAEGSTAEIFVHPNGKFVYASNRGHDSIAVFSINQTDGSLTQIQVQKTGGQTPRSFAIAPGGKFILAAGQSDASIHVLALDPETGLLSPTKHQIKAPAPVCIVFKN
jgi:6-phosphogluconolactonase